VGLIPSTTVKDSKDTKNKRKGESPAVVIARTPRECPDKLFVGPENSAARILLPLELPPVLRHIHWLFANFANGNWELLTGDGIEESQVKKLG